MRAHRAWILAAVLSVGGVCAAWAQPTEGDKVAARAAYDEGKIAFKAGDYAVARGHFERAYALDKAPVLLFNMARACEEMGDGPQAIHDYKQYLVESPDAVDRKEVERRLRLTEKLVAQQEVARTATAKAQADAEAARKATQAAEREAALAEARGRRSYAYASLGLAAVSAGAWTWFGLKTLGFEDDLNTATTSGDKRRAFDDGETARLWTNISIGATATFAVAGGVLWWTSERSDETVVTPTVGVDSHGQTWTGLGWSGTW